MEWLRTHAFIAAWCSPSLTLIGLITRNIIRPVERVNWSMIILYVAFLTCLAANLTPGIDPATHLMTVTVGGLTLGTIIVDAMMWGR
jgi:hypothetical protein